MTNFIRQVITNYTHFHIDNRIDLARHPEYFDGRSRAEPEDA